MTYSDVSEFPVEALELSLLGNAGEPTEPLFSPILASGIETGFQSPVVICNA
jgi:hypothetical protein